MEKKKSILELTSDDGTVLKYELIDIVEYNQSIYAVLYPTEAGDTEVMILRVEENEDREKSTYVVENDDTIIMKVYKIFKARHKYDYLFKDE